MKNDIKSNILLIDRCIETKSHSHYTRHLKINFGGSVFKALNNMHKWSEILILVARLVPTGVLMVWKVGTMMTW